jgi:hypothetical protein
MRLNDVKSRMQAPNALEPMTLVKTRTDYDSGRLLRRGGAGNGDRRDGVLPVVLCGIAATPWPVNPSEYTGFSAARYPDGMDIPMEWSSAALSTEARASSTTPLSSSKCSDRPRATIKALEYQKTPSVQRNVMPDQDRVSATGYFRVPGYVAHQPLIGADIVVLPEIGLEFPLANLYRGIAFDDEPDEGGSDAG